MIMMMIHDVNKINEFHILELLREMNVQDPPKLMMMIITRRTMMTAV